MRSCRAALCVVALVALCACAQEDQQPDLATGGEDGPQADLRPEGGLLVPPPELPEVALPAGAFVMGTAPDGGGADDERPAHRVSVGALAVGLTEVTVAQYRRCVEAGACTPTIEVGQNPYCNAGAAPRDDHPINCVTQPQAQAFCAFCGRRLPTEEEWEYAARGTGAALYPWGAAAPGGQLCWSGGGARDGTCPVASYPATLQGRADPAGIYDLAGGVWEWTTETYCPYTDAGRQTCASPFYIIRGGSWFSELPMGVRGAKRFSMLPDTWYGYVGFRCFRSL